MKRLEEYIKEDHFLVKSKAKPQEHKYFPKDTDELISIIEEKIKNEGTTCDLNDIDLSKITDLYGVFSSSPVFYGSTRRGHFNGDISMWDVSNVEDMRHMFENSQFNGDISQWDVRNVTNMYEMFCESEFNQDISQWDVGKVTNMHDMFLKCPLQKNPPKWYKEK